jgi:hypothetical protein
MASSTKQILFVVSADVPTTLATIVQDLDPGENAFLGDTGLSTTTDQYNWQSRFFYDAARKYAFAAGKKQSPATLTWIGQYDEDANHWTGGTFQFPLTSTGHVYEGCTYAPATGTAYLLERGGLVHRIARHGIGDDFDEWTYIGDDPSDKGLPPAGSLMAGSGNFVTNSSCLTHHPDFYSTGVEGLLVGCQFGFAGYRVDNDTYSTVLSKTTWNSLVGTDGMANSAALYCVGLNALIFSAGSRANILWKMDAGGTVTRLVDTAIRTGNDAGGSPCLKLVDDPEGGPTFYGLECVGSKRVFKYNNSNNTLEDTGTFHPFTADDDEDVFFAACKPTGCTHGAIWGIEESGTPVWRSRLYRPSV